jgi:hypothetical protein
VSDAAARLAGERLADRPLAEVGTFGMVAPAGRNACEVDGDG